MSANFLLGKTAIVTGGSGTIGKAIAGALMRNGSNVVITGRNEERLRQAKNDLLRSSTSENSDRTPKLQESKVETFSGDLVVEDNVLALFDNVENAYGGCDLLVNNAGINTFGTSEDLALEEFSRVMTVNVVVPFSCSREALRRMKRRGNGGRIINIGSISAMSPRPHSAPYTTSKFALSGLTQSLALDARDFNIAVGIIHPGNVVSELLTEDMIKERGATEGFLDPDVVANCVASMANLPYNSNVLEMTVVPTRQPLVGRG